MFPATFASSFGVISTIALWMFVFNSSIVCGLLLQTLPFKLPHKQKSQVDILGDRGGHKTVEIVGLRSSPKASWTYGIENREVCAVAPSC